jgi:hypothetical protein
VSEDRLLAGLILPRTPIVRSLIVSAGSLGAYLSAPLSFREERDVLDG